jgi:hypothetical protein
LAEIGSVQKQLADLEPKPATQDAEFKSALREAQSSLSRILTNNSAAPQQGPGLLDVYKDLAYVLRVVEGGDRQVPAQATSVYEKSSQQVRTSIRQWAAFKEMKLPKLNQKLRQAKLAPIAIGQVGHGVQF